MRDRQPLTRTASSLCTCCAAAAAISASMCCLQLGCARNQVQQGGGMMEWARNGVGVNLAVRMRSIMIPHTAMRDCAAGWLGGRKTSK
jgi:hypothetical protein